MAKCVQCGEHLNDSDVFCDNCGHKRERCSCGAFIDYKPRYCAECGRITHYGLSFLQTQLNNKKLELNKRKERLENQKQQLQQLKEKKEQLETRKLIYEEKSQKIAKELVDETGLSLEELKNNFVDKNGYIELNHPIGTIHCISTRVRIVDRFETIFEFSSFHNDDGYRRLPNIEELKMIYKIKAFCKIETLKIDEWCCSSSVYNNSGKEVKYQIINDRYYSHVDSNISGVWCLNFCNGETVKMDRDNNLWRNTELKFFGIK